MGRKRGTGVVMRLPLTIIVALITCSDAIAQAPADRGPKSPFAFVMIDAKTERTLGEFPFDRSVLAKAVERAAAMKARAVVIKFYLDQPKSAEGDPRWRRRCRKFP